VPEGDPRWLSMGGPHTLSGWPTNPSWDFVAVGRGHDVDWWSGFLHALEAIDEDMAVNIEHEDHELDQMEGLRYAAETLLKAAGR
jgi:sugar phosphate isomerase/epimerase